MAPRSSPSSSRRSLLAAAAATAAALASGSTPGALAHSGSSGAASGCPFARLIAFSEKVSTSPAGRRALLAKDDTPFSENPYLQPAKIFMKLGHEATLDFAKTAEGPVEGPIEQAASGLSEPAERDHSHGLTDAFVDAYVSAALAAHGLNFATLAAEDPVMSQRPGVKKMLQAKTKQQQQKAEKSEEEEEEEEEAEDEGDDESSSSSSLKEAAEGLLADPVRLLFSFPSLLRFF